MHSVILAVHNILRWVVFILVLVAFIQAIVGFFTRREWGEGDRKMGMFAAISLDIQLVIGILLYFFTSDITRLALQHLGAVMENPDLRFFALEHSFLMLLAVVFTHLGSILSRRANGSHARFKQAALWFGLAFVVILLGMPWARPLLPGIG